MKIGIVISTNHPETAWNSIRIGNHALAQKDVVEIYLIGDGVEAPFIEHEKFNVKALLNSFVNNSGKIVACTSCMVSRNITSNELCPSGSLADLYEMMKTSDKLLTF